MSLHLSTLLYTLIFSTVTIQSSQEISVVLVVSSVSPSEEAMKFYESKSRVELEALVRGQYFSYFGPSGAIVEDGDPLGIENVLKVIKGVSKLQEAGIKAGERVLLGKLPKEFQDIAKATLEDPNLSTGKIRDSSQVPLSVYPTTVVHFENNGKKVFFVLDQKELNQSPPEPESLPEADDFSAVEKKSATRSTFTTSGDLRFTFGFRGGAKTQRELINHYLTQRVPQREDALLKLRNTLDSWNTELELTRGWAGKSFDQLPAKVKDDLMRRGSAGGNFSTDLERSQFFAGAKVSKTSSFLTLDAFYKDRTGNRKNIQAPLTPVLNPN